MMTIMATINSAIAAMVMTTIRSRNRPLRLCRNRAPVSRIAATANRPQAPRENEKKMPPTMISNGTANSGIRDTGPGQQQVKQVDARQGQERAEHVRVLEGAGGAVVSGENVGARKGVEIAGDAQQRGHDGRRDISEEYQPVGVGSCSGTAA